MDITKIRARDFPIYKIVNVNSGVTFTGKGGGSLYIVDATLPLWAV